MKRAPSLRAWDGHTARAKERGGSRLHPLRGEGDHGVAQKKHPALKIGNAHERREARDLGRRESRLDPGEVIRDRDVNDGERRTRRLKEEERLPLLGASEEERENQKPGAVEGEEQGAVACGHQTEKRGLREEDETGGPPTELAGAGGGQGGDGEDGDPQNENR